jgi:hypothetical protein
MAETALIYSAGRAQIGELIVDAAISEQHSRDSEVSEHPVEVGANITDHVRVKPDQLAMEVLWSNSPLVGATSPGRAEEAYEKLRLLQEQAAVLDVVTSLRVYEQMVITSLSVPRTAKDAGGVRCNVTLQAIKFVKNKTTLVTVARVPGGKKTSTPIAESKTSTGKQAAQEASDGAAKSKSLSKSLSDSLGLSARLGLP